MDVPFELLGKDKVVIALKDFEDMQDLIAYDRAKAKPGEVFPSELARRILKGENRIKVFREYRGLSQAELAVKAKVTQSMISSIEKNNRTGTLKTLKSLSSALGIALDQIV